MGGFWQAWWLRACRNVALEEPDSLVARDHDGEGRQDEEDDQGDDQGWGPLLLHVEENLVAEAGVEDHQPGIEQDQAGVAVVVA